MDPLTLLAMQLIAKRSGESSDAGKIPLPAAQATGAISGAAMAALPLLLREIALRPQLKRQRQEHRDLRAEVEAGRFGPSAGELQRRDAQMREQLRQQMETQRKAQERMTAIGGSPAEMARLQLATARAQAQSSLAGSQQLAERARQEARMEEMTKRQQLADLDARREAFTSAAISQILAGAQQGGGAAGKAAALQRIGVPFTSHPYTAEQLMAMQEEERRKARLEAQQAGASAAPGTLAYDPRT